MLQLSPCCNCTRRTAVAPAWLQIAACLFVVYLRETLLKNVPRDLLQKVTARVKLSHRRGQAHVLLMETSRGAAMEHLSIVNASRYSFGKIQFLQNI